LRDINNLKIITMKKVIALVGVFTVASVLLFADSKNNSRIYTPGPGTIKYENDVLTATPTSFTMESGLTAIYSLNLPPLEWAACVTPEASGMIINPSSGNGGGILEITAGLPGTYTIEFTLQTSPDPTTIYITVEVLESSNIL